MSGSCEKAKAHPTLGKVPYRQERSTKMIILLALLVVLLFVGLGFAVHLLWIAAVIFFFIWLVGFALGRGESAGRHHFYRW